MAVVKLAELYALLVGGAAAALIVVAILVAALLAIMSIIDTLVVRPPRSRLHDRRKAADRAAGVIARIDADANEATRRLEKAYLEAARSVRHEARQPSA